MPELFKATKEIPFARRTEISHCIRCFCYSTIARSMSTMTTNLRIQWNGVWREIPITECDVRELAPGHFSVSFEGKTFEVFALPDDRLSDGLALDGTEITIESERERIIRERFQ